MTDTIADDVAGSARAVHEMLTERYDEAYEAWTRQNAVVTAMRADLDLGPGDEADRGAIQAQVEEQQAVAVALRGHLDEIALAVDRFDNGTYGICGRCGAPIAAERLALFPAATECVACKAHSERH